MCQEYEVNYDVCYFICDFFFFLRIFYSFEDFFIVELLKVFEKFFQFNYSGDGQIFWCVVFFLVFSVFGFNDYFFKFMEVYIYYFSRSEFCYF